MKKIVIVDGGPRKNMNTAQLLQRFAEGAKSVGEDVEVKSVRLYDIDYKGCMSCMACKLKGKASNICRFRDALSPLLEEIAEAEAVIAKDRESHQRDLFEAIERGDFPRWQMQVQLMTEEQAKEYHINPFDLTKVWYHGDFPLHDVGILELNRNPENFFAETEQAAFNPMNIIDGIGFSPDKMLQGRLFSYGDAQRYRLGVNHHLIPVNKPRCPYHSYHRDGQMRTDDNAGRTIGYEPNSYGEWQDSPALKEPPLAVSGEVYNYDERELDSDYYTQPGKLWRLMSAEDQRATCENTARAMGDAELFIKQRHIRNCHRADPTYGEGVAKALGLSLSEALTAADPAHPKWDWR